MRQRAASPQGITSFGLGDNRFSYLSFYDKDHGLGEDDCLRWAEHAITEAGIPLPDGEVWLQTFPRVLGYVFNPVSFWYFEDRHQQLKVVLAEVNNTFGERHVYLMAHDNETPIQTAEDLHAKKVFHVSPFFSVDGSYIFRLKHPSDSPSRNVARIEYHQNSLPTLVTSISGHEFELSALRILWTAIRYPLMTYGVIFRIHWQALKLFFKSAKFNKKLHHHDLKVSR